MKIRKLSRLGVVPVLFASGFAILILVHPEQALEGVRSGLDMCVNVVVPSLFPFLVVSSFVAGSSALQNVSKAVAPVMNRVFRLPGEAFAAVVFGLIGGFPVGCSVAVRLLEQGRIDREQAQRITLFCINAGPAFTITAVGTVMLGSTRAGILLFVSLCLSSLIVGIVLGLTAPYPCRSEHMQSARLPSSVLLVDSTERSAAAIMRICAWVTLFSCAFALLKDIGFGEKGDAALRCVFEVTGGCRAAADSGNIFAVAATLGWSGVCVICQVLSDVRKAGTPLLLLIAFRAVHAGLSTVICYLLLKIFPLEISVFSSFTGKAGGELFSASAPAAVALLCLCAVFVIDLARGKKVC